MHNAKEHHIFFCQFTTVHYTLFYMGSLQARYTRVVLYLALAVLGCLFIMLSAVAIDIMQRVIRLLMLER